MADLPSKNRRVAIRYPAIFGSCEKGSGIERDIRPCENVRRVADELLIVGRQIAIFYSSFHENSAADQAKRRENLIQRLGPEFLDPMGDWRSRGLSLYLAPSLEDEMMEDAQWLAAAEGMANQLVASLNPDARLAGGIRFLRNPIKKSVGVPDSIVVNGCGGQCRFGVYREHHGLVGNDGLGQKSWRFFSNDGAPVYQKPAEDKDSIPDATGDQNRAREMDRFIDSLKGDRRVIILWRPEGNLFKKKTEANGHVSFMRPHKGDYEVPDGCINDKNEIIPECRIDTETSGLDGHFIRRLQKFWR